MDAPCSRAQKVAQAVLLLNECEPDGVTATLFGAVYARAMQLGIHPCQVLEALHEALREEDDWETLRAGFTCLGMEWQFGLENAVEGAEAAPDEAPARRCTECSIHEDYGTLPDKALGHRCIDRVACEARVMLQVRTDQ